MKKFLLIVLLILTSKGNSFASHIVGGEFELIYVSGNNYRLNLIIYFDEIYGNPGAKYSPTPIAWIFRKSDNVPMRQVALPFVSEELVQYTIPACADDATVKTTRMLFSSSISLNPEEFGDPDGYYIVWQRCCRNYNIVNIVSEDPNAGGIGAGQTFYLEIPPLIRNGERFINSSPQLFPPLSDYACVNRGYYADFKGKDVDGDSLVYTLVEPLNTPSADPHPQPPSTAPYPNTIWSDTYSLNNIVHGNPDLTISKDGLLRVTPTEPGIFVFAVKCEEFRDGEKIGEVRRDFQMVVIDCPPAGNQPDVAIELEDGTTYQEGDVLHFLADDSKCVRFTVEDSEGGKVSLKLDPVGYDEENFTITILDTSPSGDRLDAEVCFTDCPPTRDLPFEVSFIGLDNTCPQPLQDTVRLTVAITPPDNDIPVLRHKEDKDAGYSTAIQRTVVVNEASGGLKIVELLGQDANNDFMGMTVTSVDFELADYGMSVVEKTNIAGQNETWLEWNYDCQQVSFDGKTEFELRVVLEDEDDCLYEDPVVVDLFLEIILPYNSEPVIYSNKLGANPENYHLIETPLNEVISFDVRGTDMDGDFAVIEALAVGFEFSDFGINYNGVSGEGKSTPPQVPTQLNSTFTWNLLCERFNLAEQDSFRVYFMIEDFDKCEITNRDTLTVDFVLSPPVNTAPKLSVSSLNDLSVSPDSIHLIVGEEIDLRLKGVDQEADSIFLTLLNRDENAGYNFSDASGKGTTTSRFSWVTDCSVLAGQSEVFIPLTFRLEDAHCTDPMASELILIVHVKDIPGGSDVFLPPNIFTPNGDNINEYFGMYKLNVETQEEENILPVDNCGGKFERVVIYNRWGREVFSSSDRDFRWTGDDLASGVYYYMIKYSNQIYRGVVTMKY
ncbi:hypothetical protein C900_05890 [Fulvivirga imtechensis AK7]|uniref:Gliding motility-associated C-terminal domain-containing protein n=1 Tax=Fulvivirga imtechensis AK7 TaxID=1237149 RepID=L8JMV1_9BACT|nr:gliding motility-associated C-terminal domain-containing protein [Fulvivirga imtechensis]ELR68707.1 hypothetical protein C900_05890 [Fulvivirga imtechensis AK7]